MKLEICKAAGLRGWVLIIDGFADLDTQDKCWKCLSRRVKEEGFLYRGQRHYKEVGLDFSEDDFWFESQCKNCLAGKEKVVVDYCLTYEGWHHEQFWQGAGLAYTQYSCIAIGIGVTPQDAAEDCFENAALTYDGDFDTDFEEAIVEVDTWEGEIIPCEDCCNDNCKAEYCEPEWCHCGSHWHYVTLKW